MTEPAAHILVVDDDREIRTLLREYLEKNGFRATAVGDGLTGVAGPLSPIRLASITANVKLAGAIVGPLRATVLCDESALDSLVRAMHEVVAK